MARFYTMADIAKIVRRHPRTVENWVRAGYIRAYADGSRHYRIDLDEVEAAFKVNPKMSDSRKPFGDKARIVVMQVVKTEGAEQ